MLRNVPLRRSAIRRRRPRNPIPLSVRAQVVERQGNKCLRCGEVKTLPKKATEAGFSVQLGKVA